MNLKDDKIFLRIFRHFAGTVSGIIILFFGFFVLKHLLPVGLLIMAIGGWAIGGQLTDLYHVLEGMK